MTSMKYYYYFYFYSIVQMAMIIDKKIGYVLVIDNIRRY